MLRATQTIFGILIVFLMVTALGCNSKDPEIGHHEETPITTDRDPQRPPTPDQPPTIQQPPLTLPPTPEGPLTVLSTSPLDHDFLVSPDVKIQVTMNANVDPKTVNPDTFVVTKGVFFGGIPGPTVAGTLETNGALISFTPTSELVKDAVYEVRLSSIKNLDGSTMVSPYSFSFHINKWKDPSGWGGFGYSEGGNEIIDNSNSSLN